MFPLVYQVTFWKHYNEKNGLFHSDPTELRCDGGNASCTWSTALILTSFVSLWIIIPFPLLFVLCSTNKLFVSSDRRMFASPHGDSWFPLAVHALPYLPVIPRTARCWKASIFWPNWAAVLNVTYVFVAAFLFGRVGRLLRAGRDGLKVVVVHGREAPLNPTWVGSIHVIKNTVIGFRLASSAVPTCGATVQHLPKFRNWAEQHLMFLSAARLGCDHQAHSGWQLLDVPVPK